MQAIVVLRILGLLLMPFSVTMLPPVLVSLIYDDGSATAFLTAFAYTFFFGLLVWFPARKRQQDLRLRDGFIVVVLFWTVLSSFGAVPLLLVDEPNLSLTDAVFESVSGLTTTGATVISGLDGLPPAILYYRQQLQWLGGMGIIVLAVAVLPMLGVGGMQLYRAETPGPMKDSKLTPRITETAKALWYVYLGLTALCALAYWAAGMTVFDAISHAFSTVAIGGFSTHDASIAYFNSDVIEMVCMVFMLFAGVNFALHFTAWGQASLKPYFVDPECRAYLVVVAGLILIVCSALLIGQVYTNHGQTLLKGTFQAISMATTTGFATDNFSEWPRMLPLLLILVSFVGGCAGSTGGGMKVIRVLLLYRQGLREIMRLVHPNAQLPVKLGRKAIPARVVDSVWGFFSAYVALFVVMMMVLMTMGLDQLTAFSALAACMNNLGPGLGDVAAHYEGINAQSKWVLMAAMLLGRLEIFTLLVVFTPAFWRR